MSQVSYNNMNSKNPMEKPYVIGSDMKWYTIAGSLIGALSPLSDRIVIRECLYDVSVSTDI